MKIRQARGFALIDLLFVCGIIGLLCSIALPRLLLAKQAAGAASAVGSIRTITSSQLTFALTCGNGFYAPNLTTLGVAPPGSNEAFIAPALSQADTLTRSGYIFRLEGTAFPGAPETCNGVAVGEAAQSFKAAADAAEPGNPRFFATNSNGLIWEHSSSLWATMPEVGEPPAGHIFR
ncbi:MAG: type II secretion system protein [Acidobacteria bacterium]|nr:type II secretion system protein [Acidobacteriota bacterium]